MISTYTNQLPFGGGFFPWVVHRWNHFPAREGFAQCQAMAQLETYCNRDLWDFMN